MANATKIDPRTLATRDEVLAAIAGGADLQDCSARLTELDEVSPAPRKPARPFIVKRNKSGGLFIRTDRASAYSENKKKTYVPGLNISWEMAVAVFEDSQQAEEERKEIIAFVKAEEAAIS